MITASHNAPSDNGFKCYAANGGQVIPPTTKGSSPASARLPTAQSPRRRSTRESPTARSSWPVPTSMTPTSRPSWASRSARHVDLSIVYTPMHGVGETSVAAALTQAGFKQLNILASQRTPDGDFPNIPGHVSNPEIPKTLEASIAEARATGADLVLGSDPDADRIGVAVPVTGDPKGEWVTLDGNKIGALLAAFVMKQTKALSRPGRTTIWSPPWSRLRWPVPWPNARGFASRTTSSWDSNGSGSGSMRRAGRLPLRLRGVARLPEGDHVRDKDAAVAGAPVRRARSHGQGSQANRPRVSRRASTTTWATTPRSSSTRRSRAGKGPTQIKTLMTAFREAPSQAVGGCEVGRGPGLTRPHEIRSVTGVEPPRPLPQPSGDLLIFHTDEPGTRRGRPPVGHRAEDQVLPVRARTDTSGTEPLVRIKEKTFAAA